MLPSILILDDEQEVLKALSRVLQKHYSVHTFDNAAEALDFFTQNPTQIVISDMRMPEMNGADFLTQIAKINLRSKRVVLTGYADTALAQQAINEGHISLYLNKPWDNNELLDKLTLLIDELREENRKLTAVKKIRLNNKKLMLEQKSQIATSALLQEDHENSIHLQQKLKDTNNELLQLSANLVATQSNDVTGHSFRCAQQAKALAKRLSLPDVTCIQIYIAALFYRIGMTSLTPKILNTAWKKLSKQEQLAWVKFPQASAEIMLSVEILKPSAEIVKHMYEHIDGSGAPDRLTGEEIPIGSKILAIVCHFDLLVAGKITGHIVSPAEAYVLMKPQLGKTFDRRITNLFIEMLRAPTINEQIEVAYTVENLTAGMITAHDITDNNHHKLLAEQTTLTDHIIEKLSNYQQKTENLLITYIKQTQIQSSCE